MRWLCASTLFLLSGVAAAENFFTGLVDDVVSDYRQYYTEPDWTSIGVLAGSTATLANTGLDRAIRKKWLSDIQGSGTEKLRDWGTDIGGTSQVGFYIPLYLATYWVGAQFSDNPTANTISQWSNRAFRITALMAPQQLALTNLAGAFRPEGGDSHWRPFTAKRGVSGHAAYGAVPFLSAASLTNNFWWKGLWIGASFIPGLARVDDDKHYFSQVLFGWGLSWLAASTVDKNVSAPHWIAYHDMDRFMLGYRFVW